MRRSQFRRLLKNITLIFVGFTICSILILSPVWFATIQNEIKLRNFSRSLFAYPLPPKTEEISRHAEYGLLDGNGNHCDFYVWRRLVTTLTQDEILAYYTDVGFPPVSKTSQWTRSDGLIPALVSYDDSEQYIFKLSVADGPYPAGLDLSCR